MSYIGVISTKTTALFVLSLITLVVFSQVPPSFKFESVPFNDTREGVTTNGICFVFHDEPLVEGRELRCQFNLTNRGILEFEGTILKLRSPYFGEDFIDWDVDTDNFPPGRVVILSTKKSGDDLAFLSFNEVGTKNLEFRIFANMNTGRGYTLFNEEIEFEVYSRNEVTGWGTENFGNLIALLIFITGIVSLWSDSKVKFSGIHLPREIINPDKHIGRRVTKIDTFLYLDVYGKASIESITGKLDSWTVQPSNIKIRGGNNEPLPVVLKKEGRVTLEVSFVFEETTPKEVSGKTLKVYIKVRNKGTKKRSKTLP